jgi:hypothetical protein
MNKTYNSAYLYILLLLGITLFLYLTQYVIVKYNLHIEHNIDNEILEYMYIFFFSIVSGTLLFFGFENFNDFLYILLQNKTLAQLSSATIVIAFSFLYAAYFEEILSNLLKVDIKKDVWKNIIGYVFGRILLIGIIFILLMFYVQQK